MVSHKVKKVLDETSKEKRKNYIQIQSWRDKTYLGYKVTLELLDDAYFFR